MSTTEGSSKLSISDPSLADAKSQLIKTRVSYEKQIIDLAEATGTDPRAIEAGLVKALMIANLLGISNSAILSEENPSK